MANDENLLKGKATQIRSGEEAARKGRTGGIKSGASRRRKKAMKTVAEQILGLQAPLTAEARERFQRMGVDLEDVDFQLMAIFKATQKAASNGDIGALRYLAQLTGDDPYVDIERKKLAVDRRKKKAEAELLEIKIEEERRRIEQTDGADEIEIVIEGEDDADGQS